MGLRLEGVSRNDSGNWTVNIRHDTGFWVSSTFEVEVEPSFDLTTEADLPVVVQVFST
jgi:hypothetical protein